MNNIRKNVIVSGLVFAYAFISGCVAMAADTEIFYRDPSTLDPTKPNVLFIMSTAGTMNGAINDFYDANEDGEKEIVASDKISVVKRILEYIALNETRINMGLMRYNNPGGPVVYPLVDLDETASPADVITDLENDSNNVVLDRNPATPTLISGVSTIILGEENKVVGVRFPVVDIPRGATITNAKIAFTVWDDGDPDTTGDDQSDDINLNIMVENSGDAAAYSTATELAARSYQTAVSWNSLPTWTGEEGNLNQTHSSPNLSNQLNTIIQTSDWCGGNAISILFARNGTSGTRTAESYHIASTASSPRLTIQWDASSIDNDTTNLNGCFNSVTTSRIATASDDVEDVIKNASTTELSTDTSDLDIKMADGNGAAAREVAAIGLLFKNLNIPTNSDITNAYITFSSKTADATASTAEITAVADPTITAWYDDFSGTASPLVSQSWDLTGTDNWTAGGAVETVDIQTVIEAAVANANGWINDGGTTNNIGIMIVPDAASATTRILESYEANPGSPPTLTVEYQGFYTAASSTRRQQMVAAIQDFKLVTGQPTAGTYLEGYNYFTGKPVDFGGYRGSPTRTSNRISHSETYVNGQVGYANASDETACLANSPEDNGCKSEVIESVGGGAVPTYTPPSMAQCQTNHIIMLTDGFPTAFENDGPAKFEAVTGEACLGNDKGEDCGVKLAAYMANLDQNTDVAEDQFIKTHTIHFGTVNDNKIRFLQNVAQAGAEEDVNIAENGAELESVFNDVIASLAKVNTSFVSAGITVNQTNRLTHRDELYFSLFRPEPFAHWPGNVKRYSISESAIRDVNGAIAIDPNTDFFKDTSQSYWSAAADKNDAGNGGAAENLNFTVANPRTVFSNIADSSFPISASGDNLLNRGNTTPDSYSWETLLNTPDSTASSAILAWIEGYQVQSDNTGAAPVYTVSTTDMHNNIGDPLHSQPTIITYRQDDGSGSTIEFDMVFAGTNHGFLHAFYTSDGTEGWSFVPKELLDNVKDYVINDDRLPADHEYGVDGNITYYIEDLNEDGAVDVDDGDKAYLYVGLRRGGSSYYAFDVTDHDAPELMFIIQDPNSMTAGDDYDGLGETWSRPVIAKLARANGSLTDSDGSTKYDLVMMFGGGYDTNQDPTVAVPSGGAPSTDTYGKNIFIADALTGDKIWDVANNAMQNDNAGSITMMNAIPGDIKAIDPTKPGYVEHIYVADTLGQIFRFDFDTSWTGASANNLAKGGMLAQIHTASDGTPCSADTCNRRFYYSPDLSIVPRPNGLTFMAVSLGTGYRAHPLGLETTDNFFVIRDMGVFEDEILLDGDGDPVLDVDDNLQLTGFKLFDNHDGTAGDGSNGEVIKLANLVDITNQYSGTTAIDNVESTTTQKAGWYLGFDTTGEKVLAESLTFNNTVLFTTYIPPGSGSVCAPEQGNGRIYAVKVEDGTPAVDTNNDGYINADDRYINLNNIGIPPEPQIIVLGDGPELLVGRQLATELIDTDWGEMNRIKWRERKTR